MLVTLFKALGSIKNRRRTRHQRGRRNGDLHGQDCRGSGKPLADQLRAMRHLITIFSILISAIGFLIATAIASVPIVSKLVD